MSINNVAIIGGGGNLGPAIVQALLNAKFNVTIVTRPQSKSKFPSGVLFRKVDYTSAKSLVEAFEGQDAVVSVIGGAGIALQKSFVDAAVKAGVKRFIPSEFGLNTRSLPDTGIAKLLAGKVETVNHLQAAAAANSDFSWTGLSTGLFFDWGLKVGSVGFIAATKTANIVDSGNEPFQGTNLPTIGLAIVSILKKLPETANKYLVVSSFTTTQNELLKIYEEETGAQWKVVSAKSSELVKIGDEKLAKGDFSAFGDYLSAFVFADGNGPARSAESANALLDLPKEDLRTTIKASL